ncbi:hypothetical protein FO519_006788 [Halicephalobus sp. NKZ332]|nr:hypothetical protein FO519_006788 [Halicephalobus sp. NKZ332]
MPRRRRTHNEDQASTITASEMAIDVKPSVNRFAEDTSMLGFRYLHSRYKNWTLWALLLVFFCGLTIYQVCERITYYFIRNPLVTVRTYDSPTSIEFPNIVLCPKMQLKASKVATINPDLLRVMSQLYNDDQTLNLNSTIAKNLKEFDKLNLLKIFKNAGQSTEDLFMSCQFGKNRQCIDSIKKIVTPNGLCFTVSLNASVQRPGPETTLSLLLNLETYEAIPGWISEPGIILSMFDSTVPATAHFTEGMHLESGKVVTIPINDIRRLRRHDTGCGRSDCGGVFEESEYSRAACQWAVKFDDMQKKCGCRPVNSPLNRDVLMDNDPTEVPKANNTGLQNRTVRRSFKKWSLPVCTFKQELECVHKWKNEPLRGRALALTQACFQDCHEVTFTTIVFGNELDVNEVSRFLPGDWEEEKEKRLKHFQVAFDILPKHRIPLVQNVQKLADEAQQFITEAIELFEVTNSTNETHVPCTMEGEQQTLIFENHYRSLFDARTVSKLLTPNIAAEYEKFARKLGAVLRRTQFENIPKVFEYSNYNIDLRQFENLYREGGKDYQALHEILKYRKAIQTDIIENINELTEKLNKVLHARVSFLTDIGMPAEQSSSVEQIRKTLTCLNKMVPQIQSLRKSALLRAEWMSRLQREVTVAQSYSPGPQYDKVNLLFLKIYFAHFKQELIVQEKSYNLFLLLAEIGGTIGLYVGATLLTVAETVVFFFEKNTRKFSYLLKQGAQV